MYDKRMWNNSRTCLDYTTAYNSFVTNYQGADCSGYGSTYCGGTGGGTCTCKYSNTLSDAATCTWPNLDHDALVAARTAAIAKLKKYYDASCEWVTGNTLPSSSSVSVPRRRIASPYCASYNAVRGRAALYDIDLLLD
jgi:hypothetical protein